MNECKKMMPERLCSLDNNMSLEKLLKAKDLGTPIVGKVTMWNFQANCLEVSLGNNFYGFIPAESASIYPVFNSSKKLSASIRTLIGNPVIVNVMEVDTSDGSTAITLSRKENMLDAFCMIASSIGQCIECCVTSIENYGIYVDAGNGISGLIHHTELTTSWLNHFSEMGIHVGDKITAQVLSVDDKFHVGLNYKDQFENLAFTLNPEDLIEVTVLEAVNEQGYFVYVNPNTSGIVDVPQKVSCPYGSKVVARVKKPHKKHPEKLRLSFVSFV